LRTLVKNGFYAAGGSPVLRKGNSQAELGA
jgi:hypothetical protein